MFDYLSRYPVDIASPRKIAYGVEIFCDIHNIHTHSVIGVIRARDKAVTCDDVFRYHTSSHIVTKNGFRRFQVQIVSAGDDRTLDIDVEVEARLDKATEPLTVALGQAVDITTDTLDASTLAWLTGIIHLVVYNFL